jgi:hypothetical protein
MVLRFTEQAVGQNEVMVLTRGDVRLAYFYETGIIILRLKMWQ